MVWHWEIMPTKTYVTHIQPCNSLILLIKGIPYPFSPFGVCLGVGFFFGLGFFLLWIKATCHLKNPCFHFFLETLQPVSYFTVCVNMSANELACVLLSFCFWRGRKTTTKLNDPQCSKPQKSWHSFYRN